MLRARLSYANVTATLALVLALGGGGAYAATKLAPKSVGESQLRPGAITAQKIRKNAVVSAKIAAGAVGAGKLAAGAVGADKLAAAAVGADKIAPGAVGTAAIAPDSVTGAQVNEQTLGQVPDAKSADSAAFAEAANPEAFAKVGKEGGLDGANSKGVSSVKELEAGVYCLTVASFSPRGAIVTPQFNGLGSVTAFARIGGASSCPSPQVEVQTWNGGAKIEAPFFFVAYR
jgi:hypothetical protein